MNVAELRGLLAGLPDDLPVVVADDLNHEPLRHAETRWWAWNGWWGEVSPETGPGAVEALVLSAKEWKP